MITAAILQRRRLHATASCFVSHNICWPCVGEGAISTSPLFIGSGTSTSTGSAVIGKPTAVCLGRAATALPLAKHTKRKVTRSSTPRRASSRGKSSFSGHKKGGVKRQERKSVTSPAPRNCTKNKSQPCRKGINTKNQNPAGRKGVNATRAATSGARRGSDSSPKTQRRSMTSSAKPKAARGAKTAVAATKRVKTLPKEKDVVREQKSKAVTTKRVMAAVNALPPTTPREELHRRRVRFLKRWRSLSPRVRNAALKRIIARRSFPGASHLATPVVAPVAEGWLQEDGELPPGWCGQGPHVGQNSSIADGFHVVDGNEDVVVIDTPTLNTEELKERDARIAMRLLMSQHFRVTQRPVAEETTLRRKKLEELTRPLLEREYQKQLNTQTEEALRWRRPLGGRNYQERYSPEADERERVAPAAAAAPSAFRAGSGERGFMQDRYGSGMDDDDSDELFFTHPPSDTSATSDGSVLLRPPASHLQDTVIPIRMRLEPESEPTDSDVDDFDRSASPRWRGGNDDSA